MKVFISWSGSRSKELALALREWLPLVLQYVEPWVSDKDISAGDRWAQTIAGELEASNFGIICVTPENKNSEWILFESGALSKSMLDGKVIPLLYGLDLSDLGGPLSQFQAQKADENGLMEIVKAINKVSDKKTSDHIILQLVPALWSKLYEKLEAIPAKPPGDKHVRPQHEILEELVAGIRGLNSWARDLDPESPSRESRNFERRYRDMHPAMLEEMFHMLDMREDKGISLLFLAGLIREQMPWLAEVIIESYRELRTANSVEAMKIAHRLNRITKYTLRGPFGESFLMRSKSMHKLAMELPHLIDRAIQPVLEAIQVIDEPIDGEVTSTSSYNK